jgi:3-deoxy-D-manno-octulosonic-acid transferase
MEAAMQKVPVITGPSTFNFNKATAQLREAGALRETSARDLTKVMLEWLRDPAVREQAGIAGRAVVAANQGATQRQLELLQAMIRG